jgi:hypothetical protein
VPFGYKISFNHRLCDDPRILLDFSAKTIRELLLQKKNSPFGIEACHHFAGHVLRIFCVFSYSGKKFPSRSYTFNEEDILVVILKGLCGGVRRLSGLAAGLPPPARFINFFMPGIERWSKPLFRVQGWFLVWDVAVHGRIRCLGQFSHCLVALPC